MPLYQRKKGRDLFDLWFALQRGHLDPEAVVRCFLHYMKLSGGTINRAEFEANLLLKSRDRAFLGDLPPLLSPDLDYDAAAAMKIVLKTLVARLPDAGK